MPFEKTPLPALKTSRILLVDDQPEQLALMRAVLESEGYTAIDAVPSAEAALAMASALPYDLMVIELSLPRMDGLSFLEKLRGDPQTAETPVMVVAADAGREARLAALDGGAREVLAKPLDRAEFLLRVRHLLEVRWLYHRLSSHNHQLSRQLERQRRGLEASHLELLRHLGRAAEFRDNETSMHAVRMSEYAYHLALAAGMPEPEAQMLRHACPMHDIGKIGVPDQILNKPGRLTDEEFAVIQSHPLIGAEILAGHTSPVVALAQVVALTHHERWDGRGYPHRLAGTQIPLVGRIAAICDVFDALTSDRPYKPAWSFERAMDEIVRGADTQFDPQLVTCFQAIAPQLREVKALYGDEPVAALA